jgi:hypothetical protein
MRKLRILWILLLAAWGAPSALSGFTFVDLSGAVSNDGVTSLGDPYDSLVTGVTLFTLTNNTPFVVSEAGGNKLVTGAGVLLRRHIPGN